MILNAGLALATDLPQVDFFCVAIVQPESNGEVVGIDLAHFQEFKFD